MYVVKIERVTSDWGRYAGTDLYYYNNKENAEARAEVERKNKITNGKVEVEKIVTED